MKLLLVASLLAQLLICKAVVKSTQFSGRIIDCDDAEAHEAAVVAVNYINANHNHGYKYVLNRIEKVKVRSQTPSEEIIFMELDLLETKCPAVSPTPLKDCVLRPRREQVVEGDCDIKLHKEGGNFTVLGVRCKSEIESGEKCPTCPLLAPLNDTQVAHAVDLSLAKFNSGNNSVFYLLHEIGRAQIQDTPNFPNVFTTIITEFVIAATNCTLEDAQVDPSKCEVQADENAHYGGCDATVVKIQGKAGDEVTVQCTIYGPQPAQAPQAVTPSDPLGASQSKVDHRHFHHHLQHSGLPHFSSESSSAEAHHHSVHANHPVKRALTGNPVPPSPRIPLCPGKKIFY
ncbi:alpha-2-HS-glycoprotein isoform X2 [Bombina bombina]|uniref:alpha-2-HS-glycoprotein isoform X2 n=1 Tax=Bombina bombina TaxID=8345 RepID=UPI00235AF724|nr:alpha-2-HS-glycoprotein isoform X2 [Bombina bombina]